MLSRENLKLGFGTSRDPANFNMATVTVGIHEAEEATAAALGELGWSIQDAKIQAEIMLYAELRGSNQGMY